MSERMAQIERHTAETRIELRLSLDGAGKFQGESGLGFLDHMLELMTFHSQTDLSLSARGDLQVDEHHLIEDLGIVLGRALLKAMGEKKGIRRYGASTLPMDEVLLVTAVDLSGRFAFASNYQPERDSVGDFPTEMANHFFRSLAFEARMALHFQYLNPGENEHHRLEAQFKGFGRALREAATKVSGEGRVPSTKGMLESSGQATRDR